MGNILYFSHGGGPLPLLGDPTHEKMISFMKEIPEHIKKPEAVVVISAHWEETIPTITGAERPGLFYDYYGFPKEAYEIQYPVPGNPTLAKRIHKALQKAGIVSRIDEERGFDHGLFIPLKLMYPDADIPMVQISLVKGLSPKEHLAIGKTLQELAKENILIVGSGFSFHNMRAFDWEGRNKPDERNNAFQDWLIQLFTGNSSSDEIENNLINWENAPYARYCHPREEHFIPALVCFGASQNSGSIIFDDYILGKRAIAVQW